MAAQVTGEKVAARSIPLASLSAGKCATHPSSPYNASLIILSGDATHYSSSTPPPIPGAGLRPYDAPRIATKTDYAALYRRLALRGDRYDSAE